MELPGACPNCGGTLEIREVVCRACDTVIRSHYEPGPFDRLDAEKRRFALLFLRAAGNLREMERLLGVSYPTVRKKLDELIEALGGPVSAGEGEAEERRRLLERVRRGELSVDQALARIERLRRGAAGGEAEGAAGDGPGGSGDRGRASDTGDSGDS
ncbi:MAG: DUF2089 domain-containing protein [Chloroflexi bacterium]|nr:DUF2089 domain-containing protein [Chloroflexota bacterium]